MKKRAADGVGAGITRPWGMVQGADAKVGQRRRDSAASLFLRNKDRGCHQSSDWWLQQPTGLLRQDFESLLLVSTKNKNHPIGWFCFWRSRRDSNPRAAFGDYTISSRARYDHFDTTPYSLGLCDSIDYYTKDSPLVKNKLTKIGRNFRPQSEGAFTRSALRPAIPMPGVVTSCRLRILPPDPRRYPHAA